MVMQIVRTIVAHRRGRRLHGPRSQPGRQLAHLHGPRPHPPVSAAQGVLLAALLLFGFALLQITRHESSRIATLLGIAIVIIPIIVPAVNLGYTPKRAFLWIAAGVRALAAAARADADFTLRMLGSALLLVMIVYVPLQIFERASARRFIADTYAPLVVGEAGQLRDDDRGHAAQRVLAHGPERRSSPTTTAT